jgi:hypothetical protein
MNEVTCMILYDVNMLSDLLLVDQSLSVGEPNHDSPWLSSTGVRFEFLKCFDIHRR